jgi:hypothetical protein
MKTNPSTTTIKSQFVIFGLDQSGKPQAGRFPQSQAEAAKEAAASTKMRIEEIVAPHAEEILTKLPAGRIHGKGKALIPYIKQQLYDQLIVAVSAKPATEEPTGTALQKSLANAKAAMASALPKDWDSIAPGHLVLIEESSPSEWYPAIVIDRKNEQLTLRARDYPKYPTFFRHLHSVALIHPGV